MTLFHVRLFPLAAMFTSLALTAATSACRPVGLEGDSCEDGPCALGLVCVDEVCERPEVLPEPPPPCEADSDCTLNGNADGRVCEEGECGFADCTFDLECGSRVCDDGSCRDREPCFGDGDCDDSSICTDGVCRTPCFLDDECAIGGLPLAACVEGECSQRCFGDVTCLGGGICEANVCVDPQCTFDEECIGDGSYFCDAGRCTQYTPCDEDDDCFDPNFQCNDLGRCEERPACRVDAECGAGLCVDLHCRDAVSCVDGAECAAGEECIAGRCTTEPQCRASTECEAGSVCDGARCVPAPELVEADTLAADYGLGACTSDAAGPCAAVLVVGETFDFMLQGYGPAGLPVAAQLDAQLTLLDAAHGALALDAAGAHVTALAASSGTLVVTSGDAVVTIALTFVADGASACDVVVVDEARGAPVEGAEVRCGDGALQVTGADGHASADFVVGEHGVRVRSVDGRGVALLTAPAGSWRVVLAASSAPVGAAGMRVTVASSGDEAGPVGISFALPALSRARDASLLALFGGPFVGTLTLPLLGDVPVALPASAVVDGAVPLGEPQTVKAEALLLAPAGPALGVAFEARYESDALVQLALGADPVEIALDLAVQAEGADGRVFGAGVIQSTALVIDGDIADGIEDVDGDGDITELVPDYASFPSLEIVPDQAPALRTSLTAGSPPAGARTRMVASCGVQTAGRYLPLGVTSVFGGDADPARPGEQLKLVAAGAALAQAPRACAVHAVFDADATSSFAVARMDGVPALVDVGGLLAPPAGAFILADVPEAGRDSIVLPGGAEGDAVAVTLFDGSALWQVIGPAGGSLVLPPDVAPLLLAGTTVLRADDAFGSLRVGARPVRSIVDGARAAASAP
jgi:hypothetical protein